MVMSALCLAPFCTSPLGVWGLGVLVVFVLEVFGGLGWGYFCLAFFVGGVCVCWGFCLSFVLVLCFYFFRFVSMFTWEDQDLCDCTFRHKLIHTNFKLTYFLASS